MSDSSGRRPLTATGQRVDEGIHRTLLHEHGASTAHLGHGAAGVGRRHHQDTTEFNGSWARGTRKDKTSELGMEKLLTKIGAPSYLPTPAEVLNGVRWLRENPAIAAGVVVGLTSYSVAKYYEYGEDSEEENDVNVEHQDNAARATSEEIARSVTALHLGLLKIDTSKRNRRHSTSDSSASTASSLESSGGLRSRASSVFDKAYHEVRLR
ncbi:unnamed protein product [Phytophthora fragariaefolia]|uniref:Unnamed protein product n=1 Tax=Phytophthora fragariaefolia TaxID=1490495 RepID=A0A9W6YCK6_9STRA|nr:unnamed protein product [Phytophthora fragariaefolia]